MRNDRGVSPVIGVILMVAITVILAATLGTFVLKQTPGESAPEVGFTMDTMPGEANVTLTHSGGAPLNSSRVTVLVDANPVTPMYSAPRLTAGTTIEFPASSGQTVAVIYELDSGETGTVYRTEVP